MGYWHDKRRPDRLDSFFVIKIIITGYDHMIYVEVLKNGKTIEKVLCKSPKQAQSIANKLKAEYAVKKETK